VTQIERKIEELHRSPVIGKGRSVQAAHPMAQPRDHTRPDSSDGVDTINLLNWGNNMESHLMDTPIRTLKATRAKQPQGTRSDSAQVHILELNEVDVRPARRLSLELVGES
jgi:hypothetical protein